jgi:hypothetical protein
MTQTISSLDGPRRRQRARVGYRAFGVRVAPRSGWAARVCQSSAVFRMDGRAAWNVLYLNGMSFETVEDWMSAPRAWTRTFRPEDTFAVGSLRHSVPSAFARIIVAAARH